MEGYRIQLTKLEETQIYIVKQELRLIILISEHS